MNSGAMQAECPTTAGAAIHDAFTRQLRAFRASPAPTLAQRQESLAKLLRILKQYDDAFASAINEDFGHRSRHESMMLDVGMTIGDIKDIHRHVGQWMKPRPIGVRRHLLPARARLLPQPRGVVGVISPWNFPVYLTFTGLAAALAAGNRVMLKPSELTPRTSTLIGETLAEAFDPAQVCTIEGGRDEAAAFSALPFDHLLFTGSTSVGRHVAQAAARNLTPVTLELGGKSPALLGKHANVETAAQRIVFGKLLNAGQICVSPDYALVPREKLDHFIQAAQAAALRLYPDVLENADYTSIVSAHHYGRLVHMIEEARSSGSRIVQVGARAAETAATARRIPFTLVVSPDDDARVMQEEIFGPILPVLTYDTIDEAIERINQRDRPLALYLFTNDTCERDRVLEQTSSGGVTVNDTLWHVACDSLPFGGIGASGMGAYHGKCGFDTFSHLKPVFYQSGVNATSLLYPPYGRVTEWVGALLRKVM
ncbi:coniferyl aldehyde dehydrogenase [Paraburkholderia oxyphila]|uniref:coniferyl aldehyde dehydrogenase n=1 Tax=Paraburkholderia oxyphila TaxID=614212 RepID=UPI000A0764FB|nr:coniferyl aldehyde dehydrogenase [Paraburkholderia oxyphila]